MEDFNLLNMATTGISESTVSEVEVKNISLDFAWAISLRPYIPFEACSVY